MKRTLIVGLFACSMLLLQEHRSASAQPQTSQGDKPTSAQSVKWESFENIRVLRVWQLESTDTYPQIALARVSNQDFQKFVQDPNALVTFVNKHKVFSKDVRAATPWASLMSTNYAGDPDEWLLTLSHGKTSMMAIASQPD
ncbi:MAG: hypothetical protein DMG84_21170 [Acidobacteria bacterium]|nr:MAG: hypothetical protein DMG85_14745 [Acidobacteriota bacterium]PYX12665.1 MAG: hypothetical protein DMG84_21170 [Acidobacteriota bacterium]